MISESLVNNYYCPSSESRALAAQKGWDVHTPAANELFIDLDSDEAMQNFDRLYRRACETDLADLFVVTEGLPPKITRSKSGEGWHVRIPLNVNLAAISRIALQSSLGSDPCAGLCSILRVLKDDPDPILFFELHDYDKPKLIAAPVVEPKLLEVAKCSECGGTGEEQSGVCHCGANMEGHSVYDNHTATEMTRPCETCTVPRAA